MTRASHLPLRENVSAQLTTKQLISPRRKNDCTLDVTVNCPFIPIGLISQFLNLFCFQNIPVTWSAWYQKGKQNVFALILPEFPFFNLAFLWRNLVLATWAFRFGMALRLARWTLTGCEEFTKDSSGFLDVEWQVHTRWIRPVCGYHTHTKPSVMPACPCVSLSVQEVWSSTYRRYCTYCARKQNDHLDFIKSSVPIPDVTIWINLAFMHLCESVDLAGGWCFSNWIFRQNGGCARQIAWSWDETPLRAFSPTFQTKLPGESMRGVSSKRNPRG